MIFIFRINFRKFPTQFDVWINFSNSALHCEQCWVFFFLWFKVFSKIWDKTKSFWKKLGGKEVIIEHFICWYCQYFYVFIDIWSKPLNILVLKSKGRPVFKIWYTIWTFFINAFNIFKAKHDVSYDMIMYYCSFRAVAAHQQEVISTCFYRNIKYIDNIMITYEIIKTSTSDHC